MHRNVNKQLVNRKIDKLNQEAWEVRVADSNKAFILSNEAAELSETINYIKGKSEALRTLGFCYIRFSKHEEALAYLQQAFSLFQQLNNLCGQSDVYEYFGIIQRSLGDYQASLDFLFKSLDLRQKAAYYEGETLSLYHLGVTYKYLGNYGQALDHFLKSLSIARSHNYWIPESYSLNNIGLIYFETNDYSKALEYLNQSLVIRRKGGDKWGEAGCLDNIGLSYFKINQCEDAIEFCTQSLKISQSTGDQKGEANSVFHLGNIYEQLNEFAKALDCYNKSLQIRRQIKDKKGEAEVLFYLAELYTKNNAADQDIEKNFELMNSALKLANEIKANDLLVKIHYGLYQVNKKNNLSDALFHLETYLDIEKQVHNTSINQKILQLEISQYEKQLLELEAKALRAQMNPHFIFNCMNSIKLLIQQQDEEKAINYLTTFSKLIRTIFQNSDKREITLYDEIETCRLYTQLESLRFKNKFNYTFSINETIDLKLLMVPALIIQPFIENAIWHGIMPKEEGGCVNVIVKRENENVFCIIDDDGIGREICRQNKFKSGDSTHESKGVHLTQSRIDLDNILNQRNGSVEIIDKQDEHGNATGTTVILTFKEY